MQCSYDEGAVESNSREYTIKNMPGHSASPLEGILMIKYPQLVGLVVPNLVCRPEIVENQKTMSHFEITKNSRLLARYRTILNGKSLKASNSDHFHVNP